MTEHALIKKQYQDLNLPIRHGTPAFLGAIVQAFKLYAGKPKPAYQLWMNRIPKEITSVLKPVMLKHGTKKLYLPTTANPVAVKIPDFNQLAPLMQEVGKAVFNIVQQDTAKISESGQPWKGNNWTKAESRMADYRKRFEELAQNVNKL